MAERNYVTEPDDDLLCLICLGVAQDPLQHEECGKLFCKECMEKLGKDKPCPNCRTQGSRFYQDKISKNKVSSLRVKCNNVSSECEWEGTVGTLEEHVATCEFALVPCPKQCKGSDDKIKIFMNKALAEHLKRDCPNRDYECENCGEKGTYASITLVHDETCGKKILPCPNADCTDTMQRRGIKRHLENCIHTEVPCKYQTLGCYVKMKKNAVSAHEDGEDKLHLHMALDTIITMKEGKCEDKNWFTFAVRGFQKMKEEDESLHVLFYTSPRGYLVGVAVYANGLGEGTGSHVSVLVWSRRGDYDNELNRPLLGTVTIALLNQLEDRNHHTENLTETRDFWDSNYIQFIPHSALAHDPVKNTQYLKDDTLYFRLSAEVADRKPWLE